MAGMVSVANVYCVPESWHGKEWKKEWSGVGEVRVWNEKLIPEEVVADECLVWLVSEIEKKGTM